MRDSQSQFTPIETIFYDILLNELSFQSSDDVWIESQNKLIPNDPDRLFAVIGFVDSQVISHSSDFKVEGINCFEIQELVQRESIQIDLLSRDNKARNARGRVLLALNSIFAKQQQELYNFRIFPYNASFVNTSEAEGGSEINRFTLVVNCHVWYRETKQLAEDQVFANFTTRVDDENTIGQVDPLFDLEFGEAGPIEISYLLAESGDILTTESGDRLILE